MKKQPHLYLPAFLLLAIFSCSGEKEDKASSTPLSEQSLAFEIYDSLLVDHLGMMELMDISPDGNYYLLMDVNTNTIFVTDQKGQILHDYTRFGDGPEHYSRDRYGNAQFVTEEEYLIPVTSGLFRYDLSGKLIKTYKAEFEYFPSLIISSGKSLHIKNGKAYTNYGGRYSDQFGRNGIEFQQNSTQLEVIDLETGGFQAVIPFPKSSKFSSKELAFRELTFYPNFSIRGDSLYLVFRNEPKLYGYSLENLDHPASIRNIPFETFIEYAPEGDKVPTAFNFENFFTGTLNYIQAMENGEFLIDYLGGLNKEEYNQAMADAGGEINKIWPFAAKLNSGGHVVFNGKEISQPIAKPEILGQLDKYVSKDEIWFSLNFSETENDYSVIYKTRLTEK